jgi:hypothetical protein
MKTIMLLFSLTLLISFQAFSQLEFEGIIKSKYKTVQLENGELKYYHYDSKSDELTIYNLDNSVWKSIKLSIEEDHFFEEILLVSQNTIHPDKNIEIVYTSLKYMFMGIEEDPESSSDRVQFSLNIISETGKKLLSVPNSHSLKIANNNGHKKLLIYKNVGKRFIDDDEILVYALPHKN